MVHQDSLIDEVVISWQEKNGIKRLNFLFNGNFTEKEAVSAIKKWEKEFASIPQGQKVELIWNCLEMRKYSPGAAKTWKNAMSKMNSKIDTVWLVSSNTFIRMGARTVTLLLPIKLKPVSSEFEIA